MLTQNDYQVLLLSVLRARKLCPQTANVYLAKLKEYYCFCYSEGIPPEDMPREGLIEFLAQSKSTISKNRSRMMLIKFFGKLFLQYNYFYVCSVKSKFRQ